MKKLIFFIVTLIFAFSLSAAVAAFSDVDSDNPYNSAINLLDGLGIMQGKTSNKFEPDKKLTRAEVTKIFFVAITTFDECGNVGSGFADTADHAMDGYISWCKSEGIVGGVSGGNFNPDGHVTLDQMLKMSCVALGYGDFTPEAWPNDVRFLAIKQLGLTEGIDDTDGRREITRGEAAQIICNALFASVNKENFATSYKNLFSSVGTVAYDIWGVEKYRASITATQYFTLSDASLTASSSYIYLDDIKNLRTYVENEALSGKYSLSQLGITGIKSDEIFGRDVEFYMKDSSIISGTATVLGSTVIGAKLETVKKSDGSDDLTKISIDGKSYTIANVWYEFSSKGKASKVNRKYNPAQLYDVAYGEFPVNSKGQFLPRASVPEILLMIYGENRQYFSMAIDSDGDGECDYLFVEEVMPYLVTSASSNVTFQELLGTWNRSTSGTITKKGAAKKTIKKTLINGSYKKNQIIEGASVGNLFYVTATIPAKNTYLTMASERGVRFNGDGTTYTVQNYSNSIYYRTCAANITLNSIGESTKGKYYVSHGRLIYVELPKEEEEVKEVNFGVIISAAGESEWKYDKKNDKFYKDYPIVIDVGGRRIEVKANSIDNKTTLSNDANNVYGRYVTTNLETVAANEFVAYTVNDNGLYDIYTSATMLSMKVPNKMRMLQKGLNMTYNATTKTYKLGDRKFVLDSKTMIYYIDDYGKVAYYTKSTMPTDFLDTKTISCAYFANASSTSATAVYTLRAVMLADDFVLEQISLSDNPYTHLLFLGSGTELCYDNDQVCYLYRYVSIKDGVLHEEGSRLPAVAPTENYSGALAIPMYNGMIGSYNKDGKTMTQVAISNYSFTYCDEAYEYHERTKTIFTQRKSGGINTSSAVFLDLEIDKVGLDNEEQKYEIVNAHKSSFEDFVINLEDAIDNGDTMTIYVGYNYQTKNVVYVLYSAGNNDMLKDIMSK